MSKRLADMGRIGQMVLDGDLADLRDVSEQIDRLRRRVGEFEAQLAARGRAASLGQADDLSLIGGHDEAWVDWVLARKAELQRQLASLMAEREDKLVRAKRSFGRARAIDALQNRAREARLIRLSRQG